MDVSRRYGIKKLSGVHRRTKALKKLDMSRCQLSQNGFYELIPIILKSEHVILQVEKVRDGNYQAFLSQGNQITPLELKIFSGQLRYLWSNLFLLLWRKKCFNTGQVLICGKWKSRFLHLQDSIYRKPNSNEEKNVQRISNFRNAASGNPNSINNWWPATLYSTPTPSICVFVDSSKI